MNEERTKAIERLREIDQNNTIIVNVEYNPVFKEMGPYYKVWFDVAMRTPDEILEMIQICQKQSFNFIIYDGMVKQAHAESLNYF